MMMQAFVHGAQGSGAEGGAKRRSWAPATSMTMLAEIGGNARHARWAEFVARYRPMMEGYLSAKGMRGGDREDVIQETFAAVAKRLPRYRYCPGEKGAFRDYLTGILHNKMCDAGRAARTRERAVQGFGEREVASGRVKTALDYDSSAGEGARAVRVLATDGRAADREGWKKAVCRIALQQLLADEGVAGRNREIFRRLWLGAESGEAVAESMAMTRDAVYQVGSRMMKRLREAVAQMLALEEGA
ncbi:MAG: sigma-70 family RNA polymerase sigma factor [Kiritimatiellae bacterium]|nr:sigma-70 family RNA polymerase sigma factor [Kiritimatiellia bacterium]